MIKFDPKKLRVETFWVKSLTTALGGAIRVVDEEESSDTHEVYHRLPVPLAVVRKFKTRHKTMKYIRPCLIAVCYYEDRVIALERHPAGCMGARVEKNKRGVFDTWVPAIVKNLEEKIQPLLETGGRQWFFDGRYMFSFEEDIKTSVRKVEFRTKDGRFR